MTNKINEQELEKVTGGVATGSELPPHGAMITGDEIKRHYNENVFVVLNRSELQWAYCKLEKEWGEDRYLFFCISTPDNVRYSRGSEDKRIKPGEPFFATEEEVTIFLAV